MPTTRKDSFYFGLMMCFGMVVGMTFYNLLINGVIGEISALNLILEFLAGFVIALVLDMFLVGPLAKKLALKLPINKSKKVHVIIAISSCMVAGMAFCMSFYGLFTFWLSHKTGMGLGGIVKQYPVIFAKNLVMAYPLQLLIVGPLVRKMFAKYVKKEKFTKVAV